jgi:EF-hand domain pair/EF hand
LARWRNCAAPRSAANRGAAEYPFITGQRPFGYFPARDAYAEKDFPMNRTRLIDTVLVTAVALSAVPALAQMGGHMMAMHDEPVTRAEVETKVKTMFASVDANHDGTVTKAEADGARDAHMKAMRDAHFAGMDTNKDGSISRAEFDAAHAGMEMDGMKQEGHEKGAGGHGGSHDKMAKGGHEGMGMRMGGAGMFERADADKDGKVTLAEALAKPLAHFDAADTNHDGTLSAEERMAAHAKMREMMHGKAG